MNTRGHIGVVAVAIYLLGQSAPAHAAIREAAVYFSDGKILTGTVNPGPNAVELQKATFDPKTGAVHFEADAKNRRGNPIHYLIDGKAEKSTMTGSWSHDNRKGDFKITKK